MDVSRFEADQDLQMIQRKGLNLLNQGNSLLRNLTTFRKVFPWVFIHIPKTAGTSFRVAAENHLGKGRTVRDYGSKAPYTSPVTESQYYTTQDPYGFLTHLSERKIQLLSGHFAASRYSSIVGLSRLLTIIRNPVDRVVSHYLHACERQNYDGKFEDFYRRAGHMNIQQTLLHGHPVPALGMIGLTEDYPLCLKLFRQFTGMRIKELIENVTGSQMEVTLAQRKEIEELNANDMKLHHDARQWTELLSGFSDIRQVVRGMVEVLNPGSFHGWAFRFDTEEPVQIGVFRNGKCLGQGKAVKYHPLMSKLKAPRMGYVGFEIKISPVEVGDCLELQEMNTRQPLFRSTGILESAEGDQWVLKQ